MRYLKFFPILQKIEDFVDDHEIVLERRLAGVERFLAIGFGGRARVGDDLLLALGDSWRRVRIKAVERTGL